MTNKGALNHHYLLMLITHLVAVDVSLKNLVGTALPVVVVPRLIVRNVQYGACSVGVIGSAAVKTFSVK